MKLTRRGLFGWLGALTGAAAVAKVAPAAAEPSGWERYDAVTGFDPVKGYPLAYTHPLADLPAPKGPQVGRDAAPSCAEARVSAGETGPGCRFVHYSTEYAAQMHEEPGAIYDGQGWRWYPCSEHEPQTPEQWAQYRRTLGTAERAAEYWADGAEGRAFTAAMDAKVRALQESNDYAREMLIVLGKPVGQPKRFANADEVAAYLAGKDRA